MSVFAFLECAVLTLLGSYPFAAVMLKEHDPDQYEACGPEGQCTFIRFLGSHGLPETSFSALNRSNDVKFNFKNNTAVRTWAPGSPTFVTVRNGLGVEAASPPPLDFFLHLQAAVRGSESFFSLWYALVVNSGPLCIFYTYPASPAALANVWSSKEEFACTQEVDHTYCDSPGVRAHIHNHLRAGFSRLACLVCIGMWTLLKIVHDGALLGGVHESRTMLIGIVAWCFQAGAAMLSMLWAAGAAQVFTSSGSEDKCRACYYQLGEMDILLVVLTPCLLYWTARSKLRSLRLALVHGDYLYAVSYDVPFRIVSATARQRPTASLLAVSVCGDRSLSQEGQPPLPFRVLDRYSSLLDILAICEGVSMRFFVMPMSQTPAKMQILAQSWNWWFTGLSCFVSGTIFLNSIEAPVSELLRIRTFRLDLGPSEMGTGEFVEELSEKYPEWQVQDHATFWQHVQGPRDLEDIRERLLEQDLPHVEHASAILQECAYRQLEQSTDSSCTPPALLSRLAAC
ncbi:Myo9a [Symbiodinium sp. CCMP2592]|nr:Myo9a [Symbiodinium sp. CCMP2592]